MELLPYIASYSAQSSAAIRQVLDKSALEMVARVAEAPVQRDDLDSALCDELIEMHVLREEAGRVRLATAVFLETDLERINPSALELGRELARRAVEAAGNMSDVHPVLVNFLIGIVAIGQSLHQAQKGAGRALDWKSYGGRYAQSKVDFAQACPARAALGPDLQVKSVLSGEQYSAVFIGPGALISSGASTGAGQAGENARTISYRLHACNAVSVQAYIQPLNAFLTDTYAQLILGQIDHPALRRAAGQAGLLRNGKPETCVVTNAVFQEYLPAIQAVSQAVQDYFAGLLPGLRDLLASTTSGRQGVPPENMSMHLWRFLRRAIARELYACGLFTDRVPETGLITVFFENNVTMLNDLLR